MWISGSACRVIIICSSSTCLTLSLGLSDKTAGPYQKSKINTPLSRFAINIQKKGLEYYKIKYNDHKIDLADPLAMAVMINDEDTNYKNCNIEIILDGKERGKDLVSFNKNGNIKLATQVSRSNFLNTLKKSLV